MLLKNYLKIAVCGSSSLNLPSTILRAAQDIGDHCAKNKIILFSGATTGYSYAAIKNAYRRGGFTVGVSPAENLDEHRYYYKLPTEVYTLVIYTGMGYKARDVLLVRSVDAVIFIGGGTGTLCELSIAIDNKKIIGVLKGSGGATELFDEVAKISHRFKPNFIYEKSAKLLVQKIIKAVNIK